MTLIELNDISPVGLGMYRMNCNSEEHYNAILKAIKRGYNLIDTASNYQGGNSEKLIGQVLRNNTDVSSQLFIVSKAGYLPSNSISPAFDEFMTRNNIQKAQLNNFEYSIDPAFLDFQLGISLQRVNRNYFDGYLLHNPERYLQSKNLNNKKVLYESIEMAFDFMEQKVREGKIRYYGLSSNKIFFPNDRDSLDLSIIIDIAKSINNEHHFKLLQFPFNFKEKYASERTIHSKSLTEIARNNGIVTFGNRPLNMNLDGFELRFMDYGAMNYDQDEEQFRTKLNEFIGIIDGQLELIDNKKLTSNDFEPTLKLKRNYNAFFSLQSVHTFFENELKPFLHLVGSNLKADQLLGDIQIGIEKYAMKNISEKSKDLLSKEKKLGVSELSNYPLTACKAYLNNYDLDHVLLGMRREQYVDSLDNQFTCP